MCLGVCCIRLIDGLAGYIKHTAAGGVSIASDGSMSIYMHHHLVAHKRAENVKFFFCMPFNLALLHATNSILFLYICILCLVT